MMRHGYVPAPYTIFQGIHKIKPGQILVLEEGAREPALKTIGALTQWLSGVAQRHLMGRVKKLSTGSTRCYVNRSAGRCCADVPLGAFLSGGIDSSTVVALMQSMSCSADPHVYDRI